MPKKRFTILSIVLALSLLMTNFAGSSKSKAYAAGIGPELLITEIAPFAEDGVDKYEFIELYNNTEDAIDISDYSFVAPLNLKITEERTIPSKGILVICLNNTTTLSDFNSFYKTSLDEGKYYKPSQAYSLGDASEQEIVIARDKNDDNVLDVVCSAKYKTTYFSEGHSITYKYPASGNSMVLLGQKQNPTPGEVNASQVSNSGAYVTGISLDHTGVTIKAGEQIVLLASVSPSTAVNREVTWSSSNTSVATVNSYGKVTAVKNGTANITVKTKDGGYTAVCSVVVADVKVAGVSLNINSKSIETGESFALVAEVKPESATNKKLIWSSSDTDIATVTASGNYTGVVKGKSSGVANITVKTVDGGYTAVCKITVNDDDEDVSVTGVSLNESELDMDPGDEVVLEAKVHPDNASNKDVTWKSSNTSVATVSSYGVIYAKAEGEAKITVKTEDGSYTDYCMVKVSDSDDEDDMVNGIKLNKYLLIMTEGNSEKLTATVKPYNATNKKVTWKSDNTSVATIDANGNVKAVSQGVATVTAKTAIGNYEAKCIVVVFDDGKSEIKGIKLNKTYVRIMRGKTDKLTVMDIKSNKVISNVVWKSNNNLVTVDKDGKITASKKYTGTATITATVTVKGQKYTAKCTVLVTHDNGNKYYKKH